MKILFVPTANPQKQGDLLEISILNGLREELGENCVDVPKKKILYHDFSESPKDELHGRGFSLVTYPIQDINPNLRQITDNHEFDAVIYGCGHAYGERTRIPQLDRLAKGNSWVLDGHDLYGHAPIKIHYDGEEIIGNQYTKSFKRELVTGLDEINKIYPTGFGIPASRILPIDLSVKDQLFQKTAPDYSLFRDVNDLGGGFKHHSFTDENEYYHDLSRSWFGLTCKKGGWDTLRHYEIIAAGTLLLFRDYEKKPEYCSPMNLPTLSYSSPEDLNNIIHRLIDVEKNIPTEEYLDLLDSQRRWLNENGTSKARAKYILNIISNEKNTNN